MLGLPLDSPQFWTIFILLVGSFLLSQSPEALDPDDRNHHNFFSSNIFYHSGANNQMNEMQKWKAEIKKMTLQEKLEEMKNLAIELEAHNRMLEEFGINRTDIKGRRLLRTKWVNGRWQFCNKMCQVKLKNGTEHVVSRELVFTALHPMSEQEKRNHRLVA